MGSFKHFVVEPDKTVDERNKLNKKWKNRIPCQSHEQVNLTCIKIAMQDVLKRILSA
jgi:hypothetical protein